MDTLLTLVIAIGGIATGVGAIWAAMLARRQARVTERSLTEQNERARLNLEFDLLIRMEDRFESPHFRSRRRAAARYLLDNAFVEDEKVEMEPFTRAAADVGGIFEGLGYLQGLGVLRAESVWNRFGR